MKVSVIIPTYNRAAQVREAVKSVLGQTGVVCEVIVVDDGSTDETEEALAPWMDGIVYLKKTNGGVSSARNLGIEKATGEVVAFLDSDDTWDPDKLRRQLEVMAKTGAKLCFCVSADESGEPLDDLRRMDPRLEVGGERFYEPGDCRMFRFNRHPFLQSLVVERDALARCGPFDRSLRVAEDTRLIHSLVLEFGYAVLNLALVTVCRDREGPGLSDTMDADSAAVRYACYARVQAEVYWRVVALDDGAAGVLKANLSYFVSRMAEIESARGNRDACRRYAKAGLVWGGGWKDKVRNLLLLTVYPVMARRFANIWRSPDSPR
ncbi:MAG: glycosyltransferase family 2 protein [Verrucomicrobiales bacterium]